MTALQYAVESWSQYAPDAEKLWPLHWAEIALDQSTIALDVDWERYAALDAAGKLHIVTARDAQGILQGYCLGMVTGHLHYKSTLHCQYDVYWLAPAYRRGLAGYHLFRVMERTLKARGVKKLLSACKLSLDVGPLFTRMQWRETERTFTKYLGD